MKIITSVKVEVTQQDVEELITEALRKEHPNIIVNDIVFTAKKGGKDKIAVSVDAELDDGSPKTEPALEVEEVEQDVDLTETKPFDADDPVVADDIGEEEAAEALDTAQINETTPIFIS